VIGSVGFNERLDLVSKSLGRCHHQSHLSLLIQWANPGVVCSRGVGDGGGTFVPRRSDSGLEGCAVTGPLTSGLIGDVG
jgi:hypothetical protein